MEPKVESWVDYQAGYRQAVCDLIIPDPNARKDSSNGIFYAYLVGIIVGALIYKYTRE